MSCIHNDCQQGRNCPCPQACLLPDPEDDLTPIGKALVAGIAILLVLCVLSVVVAGLANLPGV